MSPKDFLVEPTLVKTPLRFTSVVCGYHHSLAITSGGTFAVHEDIDFDFFRPTGNVGQWIQWSMWSW